MKAQTQRVDRLARTSYGSLDGAERLRVLVRHAAAGNADEALRVAGATPALPFRIADPEFTERFQAAWHLVREMATAITNARAHLALLGELEFRLNLALPAAISDWGEVRGSAEAPKAETCISSYQGACGCLRAFQAACHPIEEALHDSLAIPLLKHVWWHWVAFDACCGERLGVEGRTLFEAYGRPSQLQLLDGVLERLGALGLDEVQDEDKEAVEAIRARFEELFRFVEDEELK